MESNFIRERVVVRDEIIKKNLRSSGEKKKVTAPKDLLENPPNQVIALEELVNEGLRQDLVELSKQVDQICDKLADYIKIRAALKVFKQDPIDVRVLTNIGCNFYAQCNIEDANKIFLCIGKDIFLEMDLDESITMIGFIEKKLMIRLDELQKKASAIKAYIKITLEAMARIYDKGGDKLFGSHKTRS